MRIALINAQNKAYFSMNKDLVGGLGQIWEVGDSIFSKIISFIRKKSVKLPILSLAYIQAILKKRKVEVSYFEKIPSEEKDIIFIYGSMVDYENENMLAKKIKARYPKSKIGFIGPFPTKCPEYFDADFIIIGEPESFFLYQFYNNKNRYKGKIKVKKILDMDDLPTPDFEGFPIKEYGYFPALNKKPFLTIQASRGCPYSCSYYCAYGSYQGNKYRKRSAENIVKDIKRMIKDYGIKSLQFRDPTFGIDRKQVGEICRLLIRDKVSVQWGIETRMDLLDTEIIQLMFNSGLRNINLGIETITPKIAEINKRKLTEIKYQKDIIAFCKKIGVKISAFYIMGYEGDNVKTINKMIDYAIKLNTNGARFAVNTPFPGTAFFEKLKKDGKIKTFDFKKYSSFRLVFDHKNLTSKQISSLREKAFRKYYYRPTYILEFLKWKIREFWL